MTTDADGREASASDRGTVGSEPGISLECPACQGIITVTPDNIADLRPAVGQKATCPSCGKTSLIGIPGFAGWLLLPAIGLVLSPLWNARDLVLNARDLLVMAIYHNLDGLTASFVSLAMGFGFIAFQVYVAVVFYMKKPYAPKLVIALLLTNLALVLLLAAVDGSGRGETARALAVAAVWVPYFLVSKRVKATFGRKGVIRPVSRIKSRTI